MRKYISLIICVFIFNSLFSQSNLVKGSKFIGFKYGMSKYSIPNYYHLEYGACVKEKMILRIGVGYEYGAVYTTKFNNEYLNLDFIYNVYSFKNKFSFNFGLGAVGGMEHTYSIRNPFSNLIPIYGFRGVGEIEYLLRDRFSIKAEFAQWYLPESYLGNLFFTGTIGLSCVIN